MNMILNNPDKAAFRRELAEVRKRRDEIEKSLLAGETMMKDSAVALYLSDTKWLIDAAKTLYNTVIFVESENQGIVQKQQALEKPDKFTKHRAEKMSKHTARCFERLNDNAKDRNLF